MLVTKCYSVVQPVQNVRCARDALALRNMCAAQYVHCARGALCTVQRLHLRKMQLLAQSWHASAFPQLGLRRSLF